MAGTERKLVDKVNDQAVTQIVIGGSALFFQVERIASDITIAARGNDRVGRIIDCVRPGVGGLELKAIAELLRKHGLQSIVSSIANRAGDDRLDESRVCPSPAASLPTEVGAECPQRRCATENRWPEQRRQATVREDSRQPTGKDDACRSPRSSLQSPCRCQAGAELRRSTTACMGW